MSEELAIGLVGRLTYDNDLKLNGQLLQDLILEYMPSFKIVPDVHDFGQVEIRIRFDDYETCPHCNTILRKTIE